MSETTSQATSTQARLGEQPHRMPSADLASAFTPRASSLAGRLAPLPQPTAPEGLTPGAAPDATESPAHPPEAAGDRPPTAQGALRTVIAYVPATTRDRLRAAAGENRTQTDVVLAALDATHLDLGDAFCDTRPHAGSLFTGPGRRRRRHTEPQVQISLRLTTGDLAVLDRLTVDVGAPNRSALVSEALARHLSSNGAR